MNDEPDDPKSTADSEIEREVRQGRKVSAKDVMARLAGPGAMKGASPVSPVLQAETEIGNWLTGNLVDSCGALRSVVHRQLKGSQQLLENLDRPLVALAAYCRQVVASENLLKEVVREADVEWGRSMGERPFFEREGTPSDPEDPYTVASVRQALEDALQKLPGPVGQVRNLFDAEYYEVLASQSGSTGLVVGQPGDPRTYGVTISKSF